MNLINTAKTWFAALAVTAVAALPLHASIPRGCAVIEGHGSTSLSAGRSEVGAPYRVYRMGYDAQGRLTAATNAANEQVVRNIYD